MDAEHRLCKPRLPVSRLSTTALPLPTHSVPITHDKMASSISSALKRTKKFLTPTSSTNGVPQLNDGQNFAKAPTTTSLFPKVDPSEDGGDCEHDCDNCPVQLPRGWKIDEHEKLYGHVNGWDTHMLVATGKTDWVRDVQDEKGSVMEAVRECGVEPKHKLMLSASNLPLPPDHDDYDARTAPTTVLLLPAFTFIDKVTPANVPDLIRQHINLSSTNTTPLYQPKPTASEAPATKTTNGDHSQSETTPSTVTDAVSAAAAITSAVVSNTAETLSHTISNALSPFTTRPCPHRALILLCSQRTRDARCGQSAPLLLREFNRHLRPLGLSRDLHDERPGGVGIYFISHVGGHKFAANVMVYRRAVKGEDAAAGAALDEDTNKDGGGEVGAGNDAVQKVGEEWGEGSQCIWLARVRPEDCEGIVKHTVLKGKVVKPDRQLRGGFDRAKGLVSW